MTHNACGFHAPCVKYRRPFDGSMMYKGIDREYNSHLLTTFHLTLNYTLILYRLGEVISTAGSNHIDCFDSYNFMAKFNYSSPLSIPFKTVSLTT